MTEAPKPIAEASVLLQAGTRTAARLTSQPVLDGKGWAVRFFATCVGAVCLLVLLLTAVMPIALARKQQEDPLPPSSVRAAAATADRGGNAVDKAAIAALDILSRHCTQCHDSGHTSPDRPNQPIAAVTPEPHRITDLEQLARDRRYVTPGLPDASSLYTSMVAGAMPPFEQQRANVGRLPKSDEIAAVRAWIESLPREQASEAGSGSGGDGPTGGAKQLRMWIEAGSQRVGQELAIFARSSTPCHLTIVNVEPDGIATVMFPNDFQRDTLIGPSAALRIPPANGPFQLKFRKTGQELVVGICSEHSGGIDGIVHDFDRMRFTVLGPWSKFLAANTGYEAAKQRLANSAKARVRRVRERYKTRGRWRWRWRRDVVKVAPASHPDWPVPQTRTAIAVEVEP